MISGICFAEDYNLQLVIHWFPMSPECFCRFQSVLDPESLPKTCKVTTEDLYMAKEVLSDHDLVNALMSWDRKSDLYWKSYGIFYWTAAWNTHLRNVRPSRSVKEFLDRRCVGVDWFTAVGVHIRRTDNKKAIAGSPLESFLTHMKNKKGAFFIVATDDKDVKQLVEQTFLGECRFPAMLLTRRTEEGMIQGVADFFALTKCSKIIGSTASSFTDLAALYGNLPLEIA